MTPIATAVTFSPVLPNILYSGVGICSVFAQAGPALQKGATATPKKADEVVFMNLRRPIFVGNMVFLP
jgi:hypothetical protein